jgi:hypothetical protein
MRSSQALYFLLGSLAACSVRAAITYVDATTQNTTLQGGAPLVAGSNYTTDAADGLIDNQWHLKTGVGNGTNGVWTADEFNSGGEDVVPLVTTITFEGGGYRLFAYIWDSETPGDDWDARVRVGTAGPFLRFLASEGETADPANFTNNVVTSENQRRLVQIPLGVVVVSNGETAQVFIDDDTTVGSMRTWYDGVGYEKVFTALEERIIAVDFNKTNSPGAPSQAGFRIISGSGTQSQNSTNASKHIGPYGIYLSKSSTTPFDFRGANGDSTRAIPGGPTSLSCLVADFVGGRDGAINLTVSNLPAGSYLFRSYHLDTFTSANLGYAQGSSSTTPNTLRAHVGGSLQALTHPTALGASGLATNFISDSDIPTLTFSFMADGTNLPGINLSTVYTNGVDRFILLNGFEIFPTIP